VWARKGVAVSTCPKSLVMAESAGWLEEFLVRRRLGGLHVDELSAREAEAFLLLEEALAAERNDG
jgi:hypothetical protein